MASPKRNRRYRVAIDWDGTMVENRWPQMGGWMPGAVEEVRKFLRSGYVVYIYSCRISSLHIDGSTRPTEEVERSVQGIRTMLDEAGLPSVGIWTKPGKPPADVYIDDRAERYHGTGRSWRRLGEKIRVRFGEESPFYEEWADDPAAT